MQRQARGPVVVRDPDNAAPTLTLVTVKVPELGWEPSSEAIWNFTASLLGGILS